MKRPLVNPQLAFRSIGLETFVLDTKINKEVHQLDEVASLIWTLCDGSHEMSDIVKQVAEAFDVEEAVALLDVESFLRELENKQLISDSSP